jgi:plastocyanin
MVAIVLMLGIGTACAAAKITVAREESKPQKVEVKTGEEVRWINATGGTAHVQFAGADGISFYIGKEGRSSSTSPGRTTTPSTSRGSRPTHTPALWS